MGCRLGDARRADRPEAREHRGRARLARLARQRGGENGSHVGMLHAPAAASPITPVLLGTHPCYGTRFSRISLVVEAPRQWRFRREDRAEFTSGK